MLVCLLLAAGGGLVLTSYLCFRSMRELHKKKCKPPPPLFSPRGVDDTEGGFMEIIRYR